jgi:polysaccharide biosynthesis transport protein
MIPGAQKPKFTLHDILLYVSLAAKHARLIIVVTCCCLTAGLAYYVFAKPIYYSRALIDIDSLARPLDTDKLYADGRMTTIGRQLTAPHILVRTAKALGINTTHRDLSSKYLFKVRTTFNSERNLEVEVWPWSADWANRWTQTMVQEFLADRQERRQEFKQEILETYSAELREVVGKIDEKFSERLDFRDQQDFTRSLILVNSIKALPTEIARTQVRIDELGRIRIRLQDPSLDTIAKLSLISAADNPGSNLTVGQTVMTPSGDEDPNERGEKQTGGSNVVVIPSLVRAPQAWEAVARELQTLKTQIDEASATYLPGHRKMLELNKRLETLNERLQGELEIAQNRFELQHQELLNKKNDLEGKLPQYQELSRKHAKLLSQISLYDMSELPYNRYLATMKKSMEAVEFAGDKERVNLKYSGLLELREDPVSPNRMRLLIVSFFGGIVLGIGLALLIEYLDHTLNSFEEVESSFRLRGLGIVPLSDRNSSGHEEFDPSHTNRFLENFRVIRTNVLSMGSLTKEPHVIMVTSALPKEGKTVISSNLAASFALTGARTLLIDTDLRRGRLHRLFGYRKEPGLSNVLLGEVSLDQAIRPGLRENLSVVSAGRYLESNTELLASPAFTALMKELRGRFDRIIVDTPPVLGLSDTSIMQSQVDGVLFVIWTGQTPKSSVEPAIEALRANGANFYGFVLNRLDVNATQNYYQYYYYSHDYYYQRAIETT